MSGFAILEYIRNQHLMVPTVVITATDVAAADRASLHPDGWLEKPFRFDTLLEIVRRDRAFRKIFADRFVMAARRAQMRHEALTVDVVGP